MVGVWRLSVCSCVMHDTWYSPLYVRVNLYLCGVTHNTEEVEVESHAFVTSAPGGVNSQALLPGCFTPGSDRLFGTHCTVDPVGHTAGLDIKNEIRTRHNSGLGFQGK